MFQVSQQLLETFRTIHLLPTMERKRVGERYSVLNAADPTGAESEPHAVNQTPVRKRRTERPSRRLRVVNHDALSCAGKITERLGKKDLTVETLEGRVTLKKQHPRVTQHRGSGLHFAFLAAKLDFMLDELRTTRTLGTGACPVLAGVPKPTDCQALGAAGVKLLSQ